VGDLTTVRALLGDANDAASGTGAGVACLEGLLVTPLAKIVGAGMDNDGALFALRQSKFYLNMRKEGENIRQ